MKNIALLLAFAFALGSIACSDEEKKKDSMKPKAECIVAGAWMMPMDPKADPKRSIDVKFQDQNDKFIGTGNFVINNNAPVDFTVVSSMSTKKAIEAGKAQSVSVSFGKAEKTCKMKFVDSCGAIQLGCAGDVMKLTRK